MAKSATAEKMVPLYVRLNYTDRALLDELVDSFPRVERKKIRKEATDPYKIPDAEAVRIAIRELHKKRCTKTKKQTSRAR